MKKKEIDGFVSQELMVDRFIGFFSCYLCWGFDLIMMICSIGLSFLLGDGV